MICDTGMQKTTTTQAWKWRKHAILEINASMIFDAQNMQIDASMQF